MNRFHLKYVAAIVMLVFIDQYSKHLVSAMMRVGESISLLPSLGLLHTHNTGIAFSLLSGVSGLGAISLLATMYFCYLLNQTAYQHLNWALVCLIAGSLGNGIDRILMGYVIDFIHLYYGSWHFAVFNFADVFVCLGVCLWLIKDFSVAKVR